MNRIIREHYPAANLPEDLREGLAQDATVRVVVEVEESTQSRLDIIQVMKDAASPDRKPITGEELMEMRRRILSDGRPSVSLEEAVARIRELRDEWDD
jgi:hypothetical protein